MFEYLDKEIIVASILLIISIGVLRGTRKSSINWDLRFLLLIAISLPFLHMYYQNSLGLENIQNLKDKAVLKCNNKENDYRVSAKDGWVIDKNYFTKDSLLMRADKCELYE